MLYVIRHIDSIIQVLLGMFITWRGYRFQAPSHWTTRPLRIGGPALIVLGVLLLFMPAPEPRWQRTSSADNAVSVDFPGTPREEEATKSLAGESVKFTSLSYKVPEKDIFLLMSFSPLSAEASGMTEDERTDAAVALLVAQGFVVVHQAKTPGTSPAIHRLTMRKEEQKATMQMALTYVGENLYRAVATWTDSEADNALTDHFIESFKVSGAPERSQ